MDRTEKYGRSGLLASPQRAAAFFHLLSRSVFYEYVQQNRESNYDVPWSVWLKEQEAQLPAA